MYDIVSLRTWRGEETDHSDRGGRNAQSQWSFLSMDHFPGALAQGLAFSLWL